MDSLCCSGCIWTRLSLTSSWDHRYLPKHQVLCFLFKVSFLLVWMLLSQLFEKEKSLHQILGQVENHCSKNSELPDRNEVRDSVRTSQQKYKLLAFYRKNIKLNSTPYNPICEMTLPKVPFWPQKCIPWSTELYTVMSWFNQLKSKILYQKKDIIDQITTLYYNI